MNALDTFRTEVPEVAQAFDSLIDSLINTDGLDAKTKQLLYIGLKASAGDATAVVFHAQMAKSLGATRKEVRDAIVLTLSVCGLVGVATCLQPALEAYDI